VYPSEQVCLLAESVYSSVARVSPSVEHPLAQVYLSAGQVYSLVGQVYPSAGQAYPWAQVSLMVEYQRHRLLDGLPGLVVHLPSQTDHLRRLK
jgi:hypothetical protein